MCNEKLTRGAQPPSQSNGWFGKVSWCSHSLFKAAPHLAGVLLCKIRVSVAVDANPGILSKRKLRSKQIFEGRREIGWYTPGTTTSYSCPCQYLKKYIFWRWFVSSVPAKRGNIAVSQARFFRFQQFSQTDTIMVRNLSYFVSPCPQPIQNQATNNHVRLWEDKRCPQVLK